MIHSLLIFACTQSSNEWDKKIAIEEIARLNEQLSTSRDLKSFQLAQIYKNLGYWHTTLREYTTASDYQLSALKYYGLWKEKEEETIKNYQSWIKDNENKLRAEKLTQEDYYNELALHLHGISAAYWSLAWNGKSLLDLLDDMADTYEAIGDTAALKLIEVKKVTVSAEVQEYKTKEAKYKELSAEAERNRELELLK